ncbi:gamma-glutamyltransferase family protein [Orrella sp. JC864]|uniref:gamma-glutamyltransferase family protein n=1 Tax=Orrella sp. JC864 TaxID=3120298 RepID=UPI00300A60A3
MSMDWSNPYPWTRPAVFARNIVSASHGLATQAGLRMLQQGGNAADAAVAGAAVLALVDPASNGLGSDCCALVWDGARLHGLNAVGPAPARWHADYFQRKHQGTMPAKGWDSATVPGAVGGWAALHARLGKLPFDQVLAPALDYAERGFALTPWVQRKWAAQADQLATMPGFAEHFLPRGRVPHVGERFVLRGAAETLRRIAESAGRDFYEGETAQKLVAHAQAHDAVLSLNDLRSYAPQWVEPIAMPYRGHTIHQLPPGGQGLGTLIGLGILAQFDLGAQAADHADTQHLLIEAAKLAHADIQNRACDARDMAIAPAALLDPGYLQGRARQIDPKRAQLLAAGKPAACGAVCLTVADRNGMMVSLVQSSHTGFGSGVVVSGVSLQNRGAAFDADPQRPNGVAGGKRPLHTCSPGFVSKDGAPLMSLGFTGEGMQVQGELQTLVRMIDYGQQPQAACDAPRWQWRGGLSVACEAGLGNELRAGLGARGHLVECRPDTARPDAARPEAARPGIDFGSGQVVLRLGDPAAEGHAGACDGRRDGSAAGY